MVRGEEGVPFLGHSKSVLTSVFVSSMRLVFAITILKMTADASRLTVVGPYKRLLRQEESFFSEDVSQGSF